MGGVSRWMGGERGEEGGFCVEWWKNSLNSRVMLHLVLTAAVENMSATDNSVNAAAVASILRETGDREPLLQWFTQLQLDYAQAVKDRRELVEENRKLFTERRSLQLSLMEQEAVSAKATTASSSTSRSSTALACTERRDAATATEESVKRQDAPAPTRSATRFPALDSYDTCESPSVSGGDATNRVEIVASRTLPEQRRLPTVQRSPPPGSTPAPSPSPAISKRARPVMVAGLPHPDHWGVTHLAAALVVGSLFGAGVTALVNRQRKW